MYSWCGPCKMLGPLLSKSVAANPNVTLVKINVDDNQEIASKFKVNYNKCVLKKGRAI